MNTSGVLSFQFYPHILHLLLFLPLFLQISVSTNKIPRLSLRHKDALTFRKRDDSSLSSSTINSDDFQKYYYQQTLDHFNYAPQSYANFTQKYFVNSKYWRGPNSTTPIFAYLGAEQPLDLELVNYIGIINDNAPSFQSLSVFIEHRFYGESVPFGRSMEEAMKNETIRGYFNSAQALADYAQILLHVKHKFSAHSSPIIVVGGSYGGMLASWFRLKYPHVALGALAISAPILYFDNIVPPRRGYFSIVSKDFMEASQSCYETIKKSWAEIDWIASIPGGLSILSQRFRTCSQLNSSEELKDFLVEIYAVAAQYDYPPGSVKMMCEGIDGAPAGTDLIGRVFAGVVALTGNSTCYDTSMDDYSSEISMGWNWQTCSEMVMPISEVKNNTMFEASAFNLHQFIKNCEKSYGVSPRPHWITTYYGGHDIRLVLKRFGSNIIFSNGLKDPYSSGGVLEDINESVVAVTTLNGSHCVDIAPALETDPEWLIAQRNIELINIEAWLAKYYADLHA
ncbi:Serine carboxypeptidase S28 family protein [Perilla frutescens var. hirtella]|uniref:Serine carboxypeptidase S28 family protein n=1 Tax=Perilla frutescens var. hirtella TaxID=608512 RepID=A0AAD4JMR4_PERFH|nr:Serine carboxypeptidase S28 family protein [Perilla frutescens var. hirtella]